MSDSGRIAYINDALYFVVIPDQRSLIYCSGVNISRFLPITKGRHKAMSNPAIRGLQIVNLEIRSMAIESGAVPKTLLLPACKGIVPDDQIWYTESVLIKSPPDGFGSRIIEYGVVNLLKKIDKAIMLGADMPDEVLPPERLLSFIEDLCERFSS
jgi:hypothetical protein